MKRILLVGALVGLILAMSSSVRAQQSAWSGMRDFEKATLAILDWLKNITKTLDDAVDRASRRQFRDRLHQLNQAIVRVEGAKIRLLTELKRTSGSPDELERLQDIGRRVHGDVLDLLRSIEDVSVLMRQELRSGGDECLRLLQNAVGGKDSWLYDFKSSRSLLGYPGVRKRIVESGERAVASLGNASLELAKMTQQLTSATK